MIAARALFLVLALLSAGVTLAATTRPPPGATPPVPGAPPLPKQPPPPDATLYFREFPSCGECRTAMAYIVESFESHCKRPATPKDRTKIADSPNFQQMVVFVQATERIEARGRFSTLGPGDKRRALTMKAKFLTENQPCGP